MVGACGEKGGGISVIRTCQEIVVDGKRPIGRPKLTWRALIERDLRECGLREQDAMDRGE